MGKVMSMFYRKANRFNVENRAHRVISQEKPVAAPRHPSTIPKLQEILSNYPNIPEEQVKKNPTLDDRLKRVYVVSHDPELPTPEKVQETSSEETDKKQLPLDRQPYVEPEYGFQEPAIIPRGLCSLRQAIKFISDHQADPNKNTVESISNEYHINRDKLEKILQYYRTFQVYNPDLQGKSHQPMVASPSSGQRDRIHKDFFSGE